MSKEEVITAFKNDFPSLDEARKDLSKLGQRYSFLQTKAGKCDWYNPSHSLFKKPNGKRGNWYGNVLPDLVLHAGWFKTEDEAKQFTEEVRTFNKELGLKRRSETYRTNARDRKQKRVYAIVTHSFRNAKGGASLSGVTNLLSLDSIEPGEAKQNGMARVVLTTAVSSREITPAELLRFKMSTGHWSGEMASAYSEAFQYLAPYLTTRLLLLHAFQLAKDGKIILEKGASFMSGPGEVYGALQDLRPELERSGLKIPELIDIDAEKDMLDRSSNQNKIVAKLPHTPLEDASLDFVECSSLYQFNPRKEPTIVKDTLLEALRVLKPGGALMLTSTAKRFSEKFEEGLRALGFDIITPANTRLLLREVFKLKILGQLGPEVLGKSENAVAETYYLVALKSDRKTEEVPADWFRFERPKRDLPAEVRSLAAQARSFDKECMHSSNDAISNISRMAQILDNLSPEIHESNARLIQTILCKYFLDPKLEKPTDTKEKLRENADKLAVITASVTIDPVDMHDKYFSLLKHMANTHRFKLNEAAKGGAKKQWI